MLYDGDLHQFDKVLSWLTSQDVFEIKNEIEEVNRKMLDKLLEENEFLTVFFCEYFTSNEELVFKQQYQCLDEDDKLRRPEIVKLF